MNRQLFSALVKATCTPFRFILLGLIMLFSSCNFNITDNPGPQTSTSIDWSKKHGAFICAYKVNGNRINGNLVESIFAEKKYRLNEGFFGTFEIDCCESQLIIVYDSSHNSNPLNDVPENWNYFRGEIIVKQYTGVVFPDTVHIRVRPNVKDSTVVNDFTLYKIKE